MTEPALNPYAPPQAAVGDMPQGAAAPTPARLPVALVLRWLLSVALVGVGLLRILGLTRSWAFFIDRMVINPIFNPWPWLVAELFVVATGVLLAMRSRWVFVPLLLHIGLFARQIYVSTLGAIVPGEAYLVWAAELLVFGSCAWLALRGRLK